MKVDRRHFLAASAVVTGAAYGQSERKVMTGVIGTGNRGSYLVRGVLAQPDSKVAALCDIKPDRLDKAASSAARDNPATYADWRRVIDRKDIEAVFIATPPHLHSEMAVAAIKAGKHVYCEKPIGITAAQVRAVVEAARSSKKIFVPGQQTRSNQQIAEAIRKIRDGVIGDILMVKAQRQASQDLNHNGSSADWYFDVTKSGGYLIEQSVHNLDLCNWVIGDHPVRACGFGATLLYKNDPPGRTIFDCGSMTFDYPKGVKMSFTQNVFQAPGFPGGSQYVYVFGSRGSVDLRGTPTLYPVQGRPSPLVPEQKESEHAHIRAFYDAVTKGAPPPADVTIGATAALTSILGHEAMVKERVVNWSEFAVAL